MKLSTAFLISASAALASATGPDYNPETGKWTCHVPDAVYCAGDSLKTNIIIRCTGLVGQPGNCNDNLAGEPPVGVQPSLCYAPELHSAACVKNCIVYGGSGNLDGTFPLPTDVCTPTPEPTTVTHTSKPTTATTTKEPEPTTVTHTREPEPTTVTDTAEPTSTTTKEPEPTTVTHTKEPTTTIETTEPPHTDEPTVVPPTTITVTISECPTTPIPPATITTVTYTNGTAQPTGGNGGGGGKNTNTPVGPTSTITPPIPNDGVANAASLGMVVLAAAVAFAV
ncbi:hypothetical protein VE02_05722 [Pseudogymnoascus sp. 03VT05]|nr:hypothetical protein VE02_05722 [Pseudogymnoascus sp. 03VT05]